MRVMNTAVRNEEAIPIINVTAKPLIAPIPKKANITPTIIVVKLASKIAENAFLYPSSIARRNDFPAANSSLIRSLIRTLASTAIAIERIIPAIPGNVNTA